jgi:hypothetical protein
MNNRKRKALKDKKERHWVSWKKRRYHEGKQQKKRKKGSRQVECTRRSGCQISEKEKPQHRQ